MTNELRAAYEGKSLEEMHTAAEQKFVTYSYVKPDVDVRGKGSVPLAKGELIRGSVQVIKKNGGENNLHYHTNVETLWWVLKGRAKFYGPGDVVLKELGPNEGIVTPRYSRYWFECTSDENLELIQIAASDVPGNKSGRTDAAPRPPGMDGTRGFITKSA